MVDFSNGDYSESSKSILTAQYHIIEATKCLNDLVVSGKQDYLDEYPSEYRTRVKNCLFLLLKVRDKLRGDE